MKSPISRVLIILTALALVASASAAKTDTKAKTVKSVPTTTVSSPVTQPAPTAATTTNQTAVPTSGSESDNPTLPATQKPNAPRAGEQINWDVIASGGGTMSSANFVLDGTIGQTVAGPSSSASFVLNSGFWQNFASGAAYLCGDVDDNGRVDITDAVFIVNYIFAGGAAPDPLASGDVDCNARVDITDAVYLVNFIFAGGSAPCAGCP